MDFDKNPIGGLLKMLGYGASAKGKYDEAEAYVDENETDPEKIKKNKLKSEGKKYQAAGDVSKAVASAFDIIAKFLK